MAAQQGDGYAVLERRKNVAQRYVRGQTQWEIARAFEIDQATVSRDLAAIRKEWLASAVRDMSEIKARELAKVDACEAEAWKAWVKSQENAEVLRARMRGHGDASYSETEKVSKGQAGDPRFLELILKCVQKRCEILGVYEERKLGDAAGQPPVLFVEIPVDGTGTGDSATTAGTGGAGNPS